MIFLVTLAKYKVLYKVITCLVGNCTLHTPTASAETHVPSASLSVISSCLKAELFCRCCKQAQTCEVAAKSNIQESMFELTFNSNSIT